MFGDFGSSLSGGLASADVAGGVTTFFCGGVGVGVVVGGGGVGVGAGGVELSSSAPVDTT